LTAVEDFEAVVPAFLFAQTLFNLSLIADQDNAKPGIGPHGLDRARDNRAGREVTAHHIQRNAHGLFLLFFFANHCPVLIIAAVGADAMGQHRLAAVGAILNLDRCHVLMTSPLALLGMRCPPLWDRHCNLFPMVSGFAQN
jgi:hypothetical protein